MFCLSCGTELPAGTGTCAACGTAPNNGSPARGGRSIDVPRASLFALPPVVVPSRTEPSISAGELHHPGLPRDVPGRIVLGAALVMAADSALPWFHLAGAATSPASLGAPALFLVAVLAVAAAPVIRVPLARPSVSHVVPVAAGMFCAGVGIALWVMVALVLKHAVVVPVAIYNYPPLAPPSDPGIFAAASASIDTGLIIFTAGSLTLTWAGWQRNVLALGRAARRAEHVAPSLDVDAAAGRSVSPAVGDLSPVPANDDADAFTLDVTASVSSRVGRIGASAPTPGAQPSVSSAASRLTAPDRDLFW